MATDYKVGDKIRLVHEGVVTDMAAAGGWVTIDGEARMLGKGETIEVLERHGYKPGTLVVGGPNGSSYLPMGRTASGKWLNVTSGTSTVYSDALIRDRVNKGQLVIAHEPSA